MSRFLIVVWALTALACSKATPEFDSLDGSLIPMPKFEDGSTLKVISTTSGGKTYSINGKCDQKIRRLSILAVGIATASTTLDSMSTNPSVTCATNGTFSFTLKSLLDMGYELNEGKTYEIQLRGETSAGSSNPSYIRITYSSGSGNKNFFITAGGISKGVSNEVHTSKNAFNSAQVYVKSKSIQGAASNASVSVRFDRD
ncbi:MAG: hypothetical protein AB7F86_17535 [Bdellovibrionales bacterium]